MESTNITIGQNVIVTGDSRGSGHGFSAGSAGEVVDRDINDTFVRVGTKSMWVYNEDLTAGSEDAKTLDEFKALVVEKAKAAAKTHGWCDVVDGVLKELGLGDLLPREGYVDVTYRVKVSVAAGSSDYTMRAAGEQQVMASIKDGNLCYAEKSALVE